MTFNVNYNVDITSSASDGTSTYSTIVEQLYIPADYTSKVTFQLPAGMEIEVDLPAIQYFKLLFIQTNQSIDYSLKRVSSTDFTPVFTGAYVKNVCLFFGREGYRIDHLKLKADPHLDTTVTVAWGGSETNVVPATTP